MRKEVPLQDESIATQAAGMRQGTRIQMSLLSAQNASEGKPSGAYEEETQSGLLYRGSQLVDKSFQWQCGGW